VSLLALLVYADVVNLLGDNIDTINKNTETLIDSSKVVALEVNVEKTKYMLLSCHKYAGQSHDIKIADRSFENVAQLKYLRMTNQSLKRVMLAILQSRTFCLPDCCLKT
jgi:hypothetical protein